MNIWLSWWQWHSRESFCSLNFDYLDYKVQVPADSLIQYFYCLAVTHKELIKCYLLFSDRQQRILQCSTHWYRQRKHWVRNNTPQIHSIDVTLGYRSTSAIQYWEYLWDRWFWETHTVWNFNRPLGTLHLLPYLVVPLISARVPLISTRVSAHCQAILVS